ncbi:heat-inducible transcriptional repressor HrcA [Occallatibacter riparius]|uniref:Heat-inducible transcription repressor HrcA n=1 Tax=Occallatibacter riparius TaxID=1002689 RepID=A0A9J7BSM4_9BACT|nr:heat-inducible transcriptional repressor HrcA [Occallatibacter riparius]UWZ84029.1 heat-inducible transcriptional repressor HrcA [Occallatibacter riparius]
MSDMRISPRERLVLTAIIELYIATGEPVPSQAVAQTFASREGLSSATIRNVMAQLSEGGLLEQPHTSAGRIPTAAAFRFYVEQITHPGKIMPGVQPGPVVNPFSEERREQIEDSFSGVSSTHEYLERTSQVLALLSSGLGVALASSTGTQILEHIHFSRLAANRVLAVLVTQSGVVQDRVLGIDRDLSHVELETAGRYLNENFRGWPVERIRAEVARRMEVERQAYQELLTSVEELCRKGALAADSGITLYVDGMANLIGAEVDRERLRQMLVALEAKQRLVELLTAYVDGRQQEVRVVVGLEQASPAMQDLVLIGSPARLGNTSLGTVAVIAPTRMQYQEMIHAVRYIAQLSERILEGPAD